MTVLVDDASLLDTPPPVASPPTPAIRRLPEPRGPISASAIDFLAGRRADALPVDASTGPIGRPHDEDVQLTLWLLNAAATSDLAGVTPARAASLRVRTLQWYLEQGVEEQLRRHVRPVLPLDVRGHLRSLPIGPLPSVARVPGAHALLVSRVEPALQPVVARVALSSAVPPPVEAAGADAPTCAIAVANAGWLFARDRRLRGAALGHLCATELAAGRPEHVEELVLDIERAAPWLLGDVAWGADVVAALAGCDCT